MGSGQQSTWLLVTVVASTGCAVTELEHRTTVTRHSPAALELPPTTNAHATPGREPAQALPWYNAIDDQDWFAHLWAGLCHSGAHLGPASAQIGNATIASGNGALRLTNTSMKTSTGMKHRFAPTIDLTRFDTIRLYAKSPEGDGQLLVAFTDQDGETWHSRTPFQLQRTYEEYQLPLDANQFTMADGDLSNGRIDLDRVKELNLLFVHKDPSHTDDVAFYVDEIALVPPTQHVAPRQRPGIHLGFDRAHDEWFAHGSGSPVATAAPSHEAYAGAGAIAYYNRSMGRQGRLVSRFARNLSGLAKVSYHARAQAGATGTVGLRLKDRDGELWTQRNETPLFHQYVETELELSPVDFVRIDEVVTGNDKMDLETLTEIHFVFSNRGTQGATFKAVIDELVVSLEPVQLMSFDFLSGWRAADNGSTRLTSAPPAEAFGAGALAFETDSGGGVASYDYASSSLLDLGLYDQVSFQAKTTHGTGRISWQFTDADGESWRLRKPAPLGNNYRAVTIKLDRAEFVSVGNRTGNRRPDFDKIAQFAFAFEATTAGSTRFVVDEFTGIRDSLALTRSH